MNSSTAIDYHEALRDARTAWSGFEKLGDARKPRAADVMPMPRCWAEIAVDTSAVNPTAAEADPMARRMFTQLAADPALSPVAARPRGEFSRQPRGPPQPVDRSEKQFRGRWRSSRSWE
jgi:hypothetical protein